MRRSMGRVVSGLAALTLCAALSACAEDARVDGGSGGSGGAVEFGASQADYRAAFEDIAPITLRTQTPAPKGSTTGLPMERYFEAVTDWSDGKINFDIAYANSVAAPTEVDDALIDGRLDVASVLPVYEPSEYPAINALIELGALNDTHVVAGDLQSNAWPNEVALATDEIMEEFESHGMKALLPIYNSGADALFCNRARTVRSDFKGSVVAAGGTATTAQVEALGASASSIPYTELYEALQRGAVDCTVAGTTVGVLGGFVPAAPHLVIDPSAGFVIAPGSLAVSQETWNELPLIARQLLWDRLDVFVRSNLEDKVWPNVVDAVTQAREAGGGVNTFEEDARDAVRAVTDAVVIEISSSQALSDPEHFVTGAQKSAESWTALVEQKIGADWDYNIFAGGGMEAPEIDWYLEHLFGEVFLPHRPS